MSDGGWRRGAVATALVVLASIVLALAAVAVWLDRVVLDTPTWTATSTELLAEPEITVPLADAIATGLDRRLDMEARLTEALPARLDPYAPALAGSLREVVRSTVARLLDDPRFQEVWRRVNTRAHGDAVAILEGRAPSQVADGSAVLDLRPLMAEVAARLGLPAEDVTGLPPDAGRVVILEADRLERAQRAARLLHAAAVWLGAIALGLYAVAIWVARDRRRQIAHAGVGALLAGIVLVAARYGLEPYLADGLADDEQGRGVVEAAYGIVTAPLRTATTTVLAVGVLAVAAAWLAGPRASAVRVRGALGPWIAHGPRAFVTLAVLIVLLVAWAPTPAARNPFSVAVLVAALTAGLELLRRQTAREATG